MKDPLRNERVSTILVGIVFAVYFAAALPRSREPRPSSVSIPATAAGSLTSQDRESRTRFAPRLRRWAHQLTNGLGPSARRETWRRALSVSRSKAAL